MKIILLYSTDAWHTDSSRFLHGAFSSCKIAVENLKNLRAKANQPPLPDEQLRLLALIGQTQGLEGENQFLLQTLEVDQVDAWL